MTRKIRLGAFLPGGGQHVAAWRHPDSPLDGATNFAFHVAAHLDRAPCAARRVAAPFDVGAPRLDRIRMGCIGWTLGASLHIRLPVEAVLTRGLSDLAGRRATGQL